MKNKFNFVVLLSLCYSLVWSQCAESLKTGDSYVFLKQFDGTLWVWGDNSYGQLGDGTFIEKHSPILLNFPGFSNLENLSANTHHTLAIKDDGTLWTWGRNDYGQLGDETMMNKNIPTQVDANTNWLKVSAGGYSSYAIKTDGTLWAWGENTYGQLGDGTTTDKIAPTQIGNDSDWKEIDSRFMHVLALKNNGTLWTWGANYSGQLGDGTTTNKIVPTQIGNDNDWKSISCGYQHSIAQKLDGRFFSWGSNSDGQLGDGTNINKPNPNQIFSVSNCISIKAGGNHTIALKDDGTIWGCGGNFFYQLDNTHINKSVFTQLANGNNWIFFNPAGNSTFAINNQFEIYGWGSNDSGEIGIGSSNFYVTNPTLINCQNLNLQETKSKNSVAVFPNPVNTILYFQTDEKIIKIEVYDVSGRRLTSYVVSENKIDVSELKPGNYMLKVYTENEILNTKILKD